MNSTGFVYLFYGGGCKTQLINAHWRSFSAENVFSLVSSRLQSLSLLCFVISSEKWSKVPSAGHKVRDRHLSTRSSWRICWSRSRRNCGKDWRSVESYDSYFALCRCWTKSGGISPSSVDLGDEGHSSGMLRSCRRNGRMQLTASYPDWFTYLFHFKYCYSVNQGGVWASDRRGEDRRCSTSSSEATGRDPSSPNSTEGRRARSRT